MDFIDDFIEEYRSNPCLWKADSADFRNRQRRQEAYTKLISVATKHGELYNVERTKQKINNLRCAFRHQLRKYNEVKKKGDNNEPYCPKRRYFESLMFLKDEEIPDKKTKREIPRTQSSYAENNASLAQTEQSEELSDAESLSKQVKQSESNKLSPSTSTTEFCTNLFEETETGPEHIIQTVNANHNHNNSGASTMKEIQIVSPSDNVLITSRRKSVEDTPNSNAAYKGKIKQKCRKRLSSQTSSQVSDDNDVPSSGKFFKADISTIDLERLLSLALKSADSHLDDQFTSFGKIIAHKLRSMDASQAMYAEKIIYDVLYQGQMKMLSSLSIHQFLGVDNATVYLESHSK